MIPQLPKVVYLGDPSAHSESLVWHQAVEDFVPLYVLLHEWDDQLPQWVDTRSPTVKEMIKILFFLEEHGPGGTTIYGLMGMCRCEGYGFQAVWSGIRCRNQRVCRGVA